MTEHTPTDWAVDGPTTLRGYDADLAYIPVRVDTNDPELQRVVALVGAWDLEGEGYAHKIAALPKLLAACQAVVDRWEHGDLAEAARMCQGALDTARHRPPPKVARTIRLPCYGITIHLSRQDSPGESASGRITSDLKQSAGEDANPEYDAAVDGIEALILAHACAGINVESPAYLEGIETAVDAIANHLS
jgi:hypothetical protein